MWRGWNLFSASDTAPGPGVLRSVHRRDGTVIVIRLGLAEVLREQVSLDHRAAGLRWNCRTWLEGHLRLQPIRSKSVAVTRRPIRLDPLEHRSLHRRPAISRRRVEVYNCPPLSSQRPDEENKRGADHNDKKRKGQAEAPVVTEAVSARTHDKHVVLVTNGGQEVA